MPEEELATRPTIQMLTVKQVSMLLGISPALVYREIHQGRLKAHRFAKRAYRIRLEDIEAYVAESATTTNHELSTQAAAQHKLGSDATPTTFRHLNVSRLLSSQS